MLVGGARVLAGRKGQGDTMSETPKPPTGYATWLDYVLSDDPSSCTTTVSLTLTYCRAELAALRADLDTTRELLREANELVQYRLATREWRERTQKAIRVSPDETQPR